MTKLREETGEVLSKPMKPQRRFPWRLWLYAVVITGAAGAGGYFAWHYRDKAKDATAAADSAKKSAETCNVKLASIDTQFKECDGKLASTSEKGKDLEGKLATVSTNLDASKEELVTLRAQKAEQEKRLAAIETFQKEFAKITSAGQVKVSARRGSLMLSLPSEVLFASGSAELSEKGTFAVVEIGATLKRLGSDRRFLVVGHTDDLPLKGGAFKDNWELSAARALNVTRTLVKAGMDAKNLVPAGVGENDPISKDRAKNRRIEIALLPAINELPPLPKSLTDGDDKK
ncbi:MAG TPA: OmpA family protein [Kofleriaceae bacterium]|nr:OmpA family protein [Kofleriaceae bacterium]